MTIYSDVEQLTLKDIATGADKDFRSNHPREWKLDVDDLLGLLRQEEGKLIKIINRQVSSYPKRRANPSDESYPEMQSFVKGFSAYRDDLSAELEKDTKARTHRLDRTWEENIAIVDGITFSGIHKIEKLSMLTRNVKGDAAEKLQKYQNVIKLEQLLEQKMPEITQILEQNNCKFLVKLFPFYPTEADQPNLAPYQKLYEALWEALSTKSVPDRPGTTFEAYAAEVFDLDSSKLLSNLGALSGFKNGFDITVGFLRYMSGQKAPTISWIADKEDQLDEALARKLKQNSEQIAFMTYLDPDLEWDEYFLHCLGFEQGERSQTQDNQLTEHEIARVIELALA